MKQIDLFLEFSSELKKKKINYFLLAILLSRSFSKALTSQRSKNSFRVKKLTE